MKNEVFEVPKTEKGFFFLMIKVFFSVKNEGFEILKPKKDFFFS